MSFSGPHQLGGRVVHLTEQPGPGTPLLLLAGCGVPSPLWQPVVDLLRGRWVLRLDRPGLFGTPWPGRLPALAEEVATLTDLVQRLGRPAVLVAHSMGGPHAEALARQHPELVRGLVLVDGSVEWRLRPAGRRDVLRRVAWQRLARLVRRSLRARPARRITLAVGQVMVASQSHLRLRDRGPGTEALAEPEAAASVVAEQGAYVDQLRELDRLRAERPWPGTPTVVLSAAGDGGPSWVADQRRLAALLQGSQVVVEDARHLMMIDCPSVLVAAVHAVEEERS